jgi:hypothetical protein
MRGCDCVRPADYIYTLVHELRGGGRPHAPGCDNHTVPHPATVVGRVTRRVSYINPGYCPTIVRK